MRRSRDLARCVGRRYGLLGFFRFTTTHASDLNLNFGLVGLFQFRISVCSCSFLIQQQIELSKQPPWQTNMELGLWRK